LKLSLAITTYNRFDLTVKSFEKVIDDPRIDDIIILDDKSTDDSYMKLVDHFHLKGNEKVRVMQQAENRGMSRNKADAISLSINDFVLILDSDNTMDNSYLDALEKVPNIFDNESIIYMPDFAAPGFNYEKFDGMTIDKSNAKEVVADPMGNCAFNTANYVVNKYYYGKVYEHNPDHLASDTIWYNYLHLKSGGSFYVVPGMKYQHLQHEGSGFLKDINLNMANAEKVRKLIMEL